MSASKLDSSQLDLLSTTSLAKRAVTAQGITRRSCLGLLATGSLRLALPALSARAAERRGPERQKSLLLLWLQGGPSQLETWDPHSGSAIGGPTRDIATPVEGLRIGADYPRVAEQIQHLSVIRSLTSKEGDHERASYYLKTGYRPDPTLVHPALGAIAACKNPNPLVEIPQFISLIGNNNAGRGGFLGANYDAFKVFDPGRNLPNLRPRVDDSRQSRRLSGLEVVSNSFAAGRRGRIERTQHQQTLDRALKMMDSTQLKAFDISNESAATVDAYGDNQFGRGCLVARRLIETGVRAVEVTLRGFDTHADNFEGHRTQAEMLDPAFATLIADLVERDLLDSTVVMCLGEFGRTPKVNSLDGRDHWPHGFSCVLGGGGLRSGLVIGGTDPDGVVEQPTDPIEIRHLFATLLTCLGIDSQETVMTSIGRPMAFSDGDPIARLMNP